MKIAWTILLISAFTDFVITVATGVTAVMTATGSAEMPSDAAWLVCALGGAVQAARTIQQALKTSPEVSAALKGNAVVETTVTKTVTVPDEKKQAEIDQIKPQ